jgi:hypothetical protein
LRQEACKFEVSLSYTDPISKKQNKAKKPQNKTKTNNKTPRHSSEKIVKKKKRGNW